MKTGFVKARLTATILVLVIMLGLTPFASAEETFKSEIYTYTVSGNTVTITGVDDVDGVVEIPSEIDGKRVVAIDDGAFGGSSKIFEIRIPNTVTRIGAMCFAYSSSIRTVYLPSSLKSVSEGAFYQASGLECVALPAGVTVIESKAFAQCPKLTSVSVPRSVTRIADDAFLGSRLVRLYCPFDNASVGYTYGKNKGIDCEELIYVSVNGEEIVFDQPPITDTVKYRTLVPLRAVVEHMGAEVEWYSDMNYAGIDLGGHRLLIKPGSDFMMVDGRAVTMKCPAIEYNNRVLLPIRDVVEAVGGKISWNEETKMVSVTYKK